MRLLGVALLLVLVTVPLDGSARTGAGPGEDLLHDDAHSGRDADDACVRGVSPSIILKRSDRADGMLVPPEDRADVYGLELAMDGPLSIRYTAAPGATETGSKLVDRAAPVLLTLSDKECRIRAEAVSYGGEALLHVDAGAGHYVVGIRSHGPTTVTKDGLVAPTESGTAAPAPAIVMCHPPCAMSGYVITFE